MCVTFLPLVLAANLNFGHVDLETSAKEAAKAPFLQGLAALHCFEYQEARTLFEQALKLDESFAMAHWGIAMTHNHPTWHEQDRDAALPHFEKAIELSNGANPIEHGLIASLSALYGNQEQEACNQAYSDMLADLYAQYPDSHEVLAFYALSLLGLQPTNSQSLDPLLKAAGVLDEALGFFPNDRLVNHPGILHYYIHALDSPLTAPLALKCARLYPDTAPDSPHAQHMPAHIFLQVGSYQEALAANERAYNASKKMHGADLHSLYWMTHINLLLGRDDAALEAYREMKQEALQNPGAVSDTYLMLHWARLSSADVEVEPPFPIQNYDSANEQYVTDEPPRISYLFALARYYLNKRNQPAFLDTKARLESLNAALVESDPTKGYHSTLAQICLIELDYLNGEGNLDQAIVLESSLPYPNGLPTPVISPSLLALRKNHGDTALAKSALRRTPGHPLFLEQLYKLYVKEGKLALADCIKSKLEALWCKATLNFKEQHPLL